MAVGRWGCLSVCAALACGSGPDVSAEGSGASSTTSPTPMTTSSEGADTSGSDASTGEEPPPPSGPASQGRARIVFHAPSIEGRGLMFVDYDDGDVTVPAPVHPVATANGDSAIITATSPDRRWSTCVVTNGNLETKTFLLDMASPRFPDPVPLHVGPVARLNRAGSSVFSPTAPYLLFSARADDTPGFGIYGVELGGESVTPALVTPVGIRVPHRHPYPAFSPNGQWIMYVTELGDPLPFEKFLQSVGPGAGGTMLSLGPAYGFSTGWRSDSTVFEYYADIDDDGVGERILVDLTAEPPSQVVFDLEPVDEDIGAHTSAPDGRAVAYWAGSDGQSFGDMRMQTYEGTTVGDPVTLNRQPNTALGTPVQWSPDSTMAAYLGGTGPTDAWLVRVDGMQISAPVRINPPLASGDEVTSVRFDPSSGWVYWLTQQDQTRVLYRATVRGGRIGPAQPFEAAGTAAGLPWFSDDARRIAFYGTSDGVVGVHAASVDGPTPGAVVRVSPPEGPGADPAYDATFAPEGDTIFYTATGIPYEGERIVAVGTDAPGEVTVLAQTDGDPFYVYPLP